MGVIRESSGRVSLRKQNPILRRMRLLLRCPLYQFVDVVQRTDGSVYYVYRYHVHPGWLGPVSRWERVGGPILCQSFYDLVYHWESDSKIRSEHETGTLIGFIVFENRGKIPTKYRHAR